MNFNKAKIIMIGDRLTIIKLKLCYVDIGKSLEFLVVNIHTLIPSDYHKHRHH